MVFTLLTIVILLVFLMSYGLYSFGHERKAINRRIDSMNDFVFSTEKDLERQAYITGFRIIFLIEKKIVEDGNPISNLNSTFEECFFNGTLYGQYQDLMNGVKFSDILKSINERANKSNIEVSLYPRRFYLNQEDPWHIKVNFETDILIKDKGALALWNKTEIISSKIKIDNFEDPLYIINTRGLVANKINKTTYQQFASGSDTTNLSLHSQNSYYIASPLGPSFLDRLEGKTAPNANGIESLVYLPKLSEQGIPILSKSCVDYIYFSSSNPESHAITGMPSWFRLDDVHLSVYNVTELAV